MPENVIIGLVVIGIGAILCVLAYIGYRTWDSWVGVILSAILGIFMVISGLLNCFYDGSDARKNITVHFLDTDTYVVFEDAQLLYGSKGGKCIITEDGERIQIVNAEITVSDTE